MIRHKLSARSRRETALYGFLPASSFLRSWGTILAHSCNQESLDHDTHLA
jgi:hypothetical protein